MKSLRARITAVTVIVAIVAVAVTGLLSLQLARSLTTDQARAQLQAQADILARLPELATAAELSDKASLALGGTIVALVDSEGGIEGSASEYVDQAILARLAAGESVSVLRRGPSGFAIVEARPAEGGGAIVLVLPTSSLERALGLATGRILIALGLGLVIAIVGGTLLARLISRPLVETATAARRLAAGERNVGMPPSKTAEIADVTTALAALDAALASSEGRQREFLLSISHELRTPLTAMRGYGEALSDGLVTDVEAVGRTLVTETERLDRFVGDLLELARLEADDFSVTTSAVALPALLEEIVAAWSGKAATLGISITGSSAVDSIVTDGRRLRQVLDGLVENALRVTPTGSSVELRASDGVVIEVLDGGPGLAPEDIAVAFDRGVLRARYRDIRPVGTGLGLSIAARLITRLGGSLSVANSDSGGAVFAVRLPNSP